MRKKRESQPETGGDQLLRQYDGIGIKAVAAAVEPGRREQGKEKRPAEEDRTTIVKRKAANK